MNPTKNPAGTPVLKDASPAKVDGNFKNFENLASKLVQVPKAEIDEKRQKS